MPTNRPANVIVSTIVLYNDGLFRIKFLVVFISISFLSIVLRVPILPRNRFYLGTREFRKNRLTIVALGKRPLEFDSRLSTEGNCRAYQVGLPASDLGYCGRHFPGHSEAAVTFMTPRSHASRCRCSL